MPVVMLLKCSGSAVFMIRRYVKFIDHGSALGVILQVPGAVGVLDAEVKKPELWELCSFRLDPSLRLGSAC